MSTAYHLPVILLLVLGAMLCVAVAYREIHDIVHGASTGMVMPFYLVMLVAVSLALVGLIDSLDQGKRLTAQDLANMVCYHVNGEMFCYRNPVEVTQQ